MLENWFQNITILTFHLSYRQENHQQGNTTTTKEQNDSIPPLDGQTLLSSRFDFENLTQSDEAREPPTSGHQSVMEGPRILLIVFIALYYTYTMAKHQ